MDISASSLFEEEKVMLAVKMMDAESCQRNANFKENEKKGGKKVANKDVTGIDLIRP